MLEQLLALEKEYYRPYELARVFGVTTRTVRRWVTDGVIPSVLTPKGSHRIPRQSLLLASRKFPTR